MVTLIPCDFKKRIAVNDRLSEPGTSVMAS